MFNARLWRWESKKREEREEERKDEEESRGERRGKKQKKLTETVSNACSISVSRPIPSPNYIHGFKFSEIASHVYRDPLIM